MVKDTEWGASSGLPEGEFWIDNAEFGYLPEVKDGNQLLLMLNGRLTDDDGDVSEEQYRFTVGQGWTRAKGGKEAVKDNGKADATFNANSAYAKFFIAAAQLPGVQDVLRKRGNQRQATVWEGLGFEISQVKSEFPDRQTGNKVEFYTATPVRFLGESKGEKKAAAKAEAKEEAGTGEKKETPAEKAKRVKAEKDAAKAAEANGNGQGEETGDLLSQLTALAKASDTHTDFVTAAFELPGVEGSEYEDQVLDEDQLYATARS